MPSLTPLLLSTQGSERATTGPGNNIVTRAGKTHIVWQDSDAKGYWAKARTFDQVTGALTPAVTIGPGSDNHARPCVTIDRAGYLHVVIGGHGDMCYYYRSAQPHDASAWNAPEPVGNGTYPMIICSPDDTLALTYRDKALAGIELLIRPAGGAWESRGLIFAKHPKYNKGYGGYNGATVFGPGNTLHFAADVYEGTDFYNHRGTHQAIIYAASDDLGRTWRKSDGTPLPGIPLPNQLDKIAIIDAGENGASLRPQLRNGGVVVDAKGRPFVYYCEVCDGVGTPRLVTPDANGGWRHLPLAEAFFKKWPGMVVRDARGHISCTENGTIHILTVFMPQRPEEPLGAKATNVSERQANFGLGLVTSRDGGETFTTRELLPFDPDGDIHQFTLERPVGAQDLHDGTPAVAPSIIWTQGLQRYPLKGEVIDTKVWFARP